MLKRALSVVVGGVMLAAVGWPVWPVLGQLVGQPTGDMPGALIVFPKVLVDQNKGIDTVIQLSNAEGSLTDPVPSGEPATQVQCFYVDDKCVEKNWVFRLTPGQPTGWVASEGSPALANPTFENGAPPVVPVNGRWLGELKCYVLDELGFPAPRNNLVGAATIYKHVAGETLDVESYNGIGFRAVANESAFTDEVLCLGGEESDECPFGAEYVGCAGVLLLDHRFDESAARDLSDNSSLRTGISIVPCTEDILHQRAFSRALQLLVYNEFEQRFSVTSSLTCRLDAYLRDLSFAPVFDAAVQGTVAGQTRIRSATGDGLLAIATEYRTDAAGDKGSGAFHLSQFGSAIQDLVTVVPPPTD